MALKNITLLITFIFILGNNLYAQDKGNFRLRGIVKRSSVVMASSSHNGINYFHNSNQGTRITIDNESVEYNKPGKFQIPLDNKRHLVTIQTI